MPFVSYAIDGAGIVADQQARFEPARDGSVRVIDAQIKVFDEYRARGERPFTSGGKSDLLRLQVRRAIVWHGKPTRLHSAIRPQRDVHVVRNQPADWRHVRRVAKDSG